jgi:hypothetical protein
MWRRRPTASMRPPGSSSSPPAACACNLRGTAPRDPQDKPGGRVQVCLAKHLWAHRRAPSTVAAGDETPMNFHETEVL